MWPRLKTRHRKMQILPRLSLLPHDRKWRGLRRDKTNFPGKHRHLNLNSPDQQHGTTTMSKSKLQALLPKTPHNGRCFLREGRQTNRNKQAGAELTPCALFSKYLTHTHTHTHPSLFLCGLADFLVWAYNNKVAVKWQLQPWIHSSVYLIGLTCFSGENYTENTHLNSSKGTFSCH